jgi:hypothetical protein
MQLCFVSVHGPRETYFVDEPHISELMFDGPVLVRKWLLGPVYGAGTGLPLHVSAGMCHQAG